MEFSKLKEGEILSETQYYKVAKIKDNKVQLENDNGENIVVDSNYVEKFLTSSTQFLDTQKVNKTELAEIVLSNPRVAMTVSYHKQVDSKELLKRVNDIFHTKTNPTQTQILVDIAVREGLKGEPRTMIGRHYGNLESNGRLKFIDMNEPLDKSKSYDIRIRLVDLRTVTEVIVHNTRYVLK